MMIDIQALACYTESAETNITGRFVLGHLTQSKIVGKVPLVSRTNVPLFVSATMANSLGAFCMKNMTEFEIGWLAGILEGEGSFTWRVSKKRFASYGVPAVRIGMTDLDIIQKVQSLIGGNITIDKPRLSHYKTQYRIARQGYMAVEIMSLILPYMGQRRSQQIKLMIDQWNTRPGKRLGSCSKAAKLTEDEVRNIRTKYALGQESWNSLSREFGVTKRAIGSIVQRKTWKHIS